MMPVRFMNGKSAGRMMREKRCAPLSPAIGVQIAPTEIEPAVAWQRSMVYLPVRSTRFAVRSP